MARCVVLSIFRRILTLTALAALAVAAASCGEGRFPVCKSNDECAARLDDKAKGPKVCYNLRCVECRYDTDCPTGQACNATLSTCKDIAATSDDPDNKGTKVIDAPAPTGPKDWDECATACKDPDCIQACDQRFRK